MSISSVLSALPALPALYMFSIIAPFCWFIIAMIHAYWALGGRWAADVVFPTDPARELAKPTVAMTWLVTVLFMSCAGIQAMIVGAIFSQSQIHGFFLDNRLFWYIDCLILLVLTLRIVGEGKYVGLTKKIRTTQFAIYDDRIYTPLCMVIAASSLVQVLCLEH